MSERVKEKLDTIGMKNQSYSEIIEHLLDHYVRTTDVAANMVKRYKSLQAEGSKK